MPVWNIFTKGTKSEGRVNRTKLLGSVYGNMSEHLIHLIIMYLILYTHAHTHTYWGVHSDCLDEVLLSGNN